MCILIYCDCFHHFMEKFCSVLFLLYSTWFCELLKNRPDEFKNTTMFDNSTLRDFNFLLDLEGHCDPSSFVKLCWTRN